MTVNITPKKKEALAQLGLHDVNDIMQFFPSHYDIYEKVDYSQWTIDQKVVFEATIISRPKLVYYQGKRSLLTFDVDAGFEHLRISIFNRPWLARKPVGSMITIIGRYQGSRKVLALQTNDQPLDQLLGIKPVYPLKDKVPAKWFSQLMAELLKDYRSQVTDIVPAAYQEKRGLMKWYEALCQIHFPQSAAKLNQALKTIKYEEFLVYQCLMQKRRQSRLAQTRTTGRPIDRAKIDAFIASLPYQLTADQMTAVEAILKDMAGRVQMCRLVQGDVGCGKTVVAFIAMYAAALSGRQAVLMAPTAILARQHYANLQKYFGRFNVKAVLLYAGCSSQQRAESLAAMADGSAQMIVGTHSLFQDEVVIKDLGLIVTDEQQRFGVKQRQLLQDKGRQADLLLMSATPIPRTLAAGLYGDMDVSSICTMPNANKNVTTKLVRQNSFMALVDTIEPFLQAGEQMFVICATIDKNDDYKVRNVNDIYANLRQFYYDRHTVGLMHGQMDDEQKNAVMEDFRSHKIDILVTTTVVEVGVDIKNANLMIIYDANRFGMSQLHQLRGRIGRGSQPGLCWLLTDTQDEQALKRLQIIAENNDGFKIAYYDLQQRGPGDLLGYRQSGLPVFMVGNIIEDQDILQICQQDSQQIMADSGAVGNEALMAYLHKFSQDTGYHLD